MSIQGVQCNGLIDTGADVSLLGSSFVNGLIGKVSITLERIKESVKVLGGGTLDVNAKCMICLKVGSIDIHHQFWVVPMATDCILGGDFLCRHRGIIDYKDMVFTINNEKVPLRQLNEEYHRNNRYRTLNNRLK